MRRAGIGWVLAGWLCAAAVPASASPQVDLVQAELAALANYGRTAVACVKTLPSREPVILELCIQELEADMDRVMRLMAVVEYDQWGPAFKRATKDEKWQLYRQIQGGLRAGYWIMEFWLVLHQVAYENDEGEWEYR